MQIIGSRTSHDTLASVTTINLVSVCSILSVKFGGASGVISIQPGLQQVLSEILKLLLSPQLLDMTSVDKK